MPLRELSGAVDDALDNIDRGTFFLTRFRIGEADRDIIRELADLTAILLRCAQEFYKAIAAATESSARRSREDLSEFFESIGRLDTLTKLKDVREREFLEQIFESRESAGRIERLREIGSQISSAVDNLARAGFLVYDSIFNPGQIGN
jgi:hypothetical protein